ncbi:MAG: tRNA (guanosine(37)-N1)-methyltransferase TrmD [Rhodothermaceae bacterium]|nr:tRNA (guanosine(37)-N1)-methyltransferase TrmD [Rhodothermaceae bacterium]MYF64213.1 tRNA (guanosine(37)-N1)-methyltransferase TrmD [Rhodothermaceae bacterium]MYI83854.1 tRNA (guanosine(37)-N1)-methyltransferase TrmD [Rhodothermaceae bacterium]
MRIDILTALPDQVERAVDLTVLRRAEDKIALHVHDLGSYARGRHKQIDDYPYGGGGGMVLKPEPIFACIEALGDTPDEVIYLSPDGEPLTQALANTLSLKKHIVLLAGHYKGIDHRVREVLVTREVSVGDYVLSGGELPALLVADAVARLIPGVLGDAQSALEDSFQDGLLGAPAYTRPASFRGLEVPEVLCSGNHSSIAEWREEVRQQRTRERRPDLWQQYVAREKT